MKPFIIAIGGPTASGKTAVALELATLLNTEIINADSRQIYQELNIGVAKPSAQELAKVKHHFVSETSIHTNFTAGDFAKQAREKMEQILQEKDCVIICGGTGLYFEGVIQGFDSTGADNAIRTQVDALYAEGGLDKLLDLLKQDFPSIVGAVDINNPMRVRRLLEKALAGQITIPVSSPYQLPWPVYGYYLNPNREVLYDNINSRTKKMVEDGLEVEAKNLEEFKHLNALKTVGYTEYFEYFAHKYDLTRCIELIQQHTRNYAKRQLTWFKNRTPFSPIAPFNAVNTILTDLKTNGYTVHQ